MSSLIQDLQTRQNTLQEFSDLTLRILKYLPNIVTDNIPSRGYVIYRSTSAGTTKLSRPIKDELYIRKPVRFESSYKEYLKILKNAAHGKKKFTEDDHRLINSVTYTIQQSIGVGLDFLSNPNSARKHIGNRFEELIRLIVSEIGIRNKKVVLKIPYGEGHTYSAETDLIFSPFESVRSDNSKLDPKEVVVSLKTSSKDRMGKIFIDKLLMQRFVQHDVKVIGIFLNDVQRKEEGGISFTFVSGLFMVYAKFLTKLEGIYFIDPPQGVLEKPYSEFIASFSKFVLEDAKKLIS